MPVAPSKVEDPCQECRDRHLKCDDERPQCRQCERLQKACARANRAREFRFGSSARYDQTFPKDQIWLDHPRTTRFRFLDHGPELKNYYCTESPEQIPVVGSPFFANLASEHDKVSEANSTWVVPGSKTIHRTKPTHAHTHNANSSALLLPMSSSTVNTEDISRIKRHKPGGHEAQGTSSTFRAPTPPDPRACRCSATDGLPKESVPLDYQHTSSTHNSQAALKKVNAEYERLKDDQAAWVPPNELLSPAIWKRHFFWPNEKTTTQCACLMKYYTERLGPWFDIGDPSRHFTLMVPQRARRCPPLLNAIFTVAARHLTHLPEHRNSTGAVRYHGHVMPELDSGFSIKYQNASIAYLRELCKHPQHVQDEDLLAATVILRYYDEFEASLDGTPNETVFRSIQLFVAAQSRQFFLPNSNHLAIDFRVAGSFTAVRKELETYLKSYHHASFRLALRQECSRAFMKQEPVGLNLDSWTILQGFDEADDFVWADRHLYHLACVLQFCFDRADRSYLSTARWQELKRFEDQWDEHKPASFAAIHYKGANAAAGEPLPEIWYLADVHGAAMQYFQLSQILMTAYSPSIPRLGPGAVSAGRKVSQDVRRLVLSVCGIAASMPGSEPLLFQAAMAVASCGEHFIDRPEEQQALLQILRQLEVDHGFPTQATVDNINQSWLT